MNSLGRNTGYNLLGLAAPLLLSLVTIPLYLHLIGPERYGVLAIAWLLLGYFGLFDLGLGRATAYWIAADREAAPDRRAQTFWTATFMNPAIGAVGAAFLWAVSRWYFGSLFEVREALRPEILNSVLLLALAVPVATLSGTLTGTLQGLERFGQLNVISATSTALFQLLPLMVAAILGPNLPMLIGAALLARLLGCAWLGNTAWRAVARGYPPRMSRKRLGDLLRYGGWAAVSSLIGPLLLLSDRFVIGAAFGAVAVTLYSVPFQLIQRTMILPTALNSALMPRMAAAEPEERKRLGDAGHAVLEALLTPMLLVAILVAESALNLWVGSSLGIQMAPLARLMVVHVWLFALSAMRITMNYASGRPRAVTLAYLIELPLYVLVLIGAIHWFGLIGAAGALVFRSAIDLLIQGWSYDRLLPRPRIWLQLALLLTAAWLSGSEVVGPAIKALGGACLVVIALSMASKGISGDGRAMISEAWQRSPKGRG